MEGPQSETVQPFVDKPMDENTESMVRKKKVVQPLSTFNPNTEKPNEPKKRRAVPVIQLAAPKRRPKNAEEKAVPPKQIKKEAPKKIDETSEKQAIPIYEDQEAEKQEQVAVVDNKDKGALRNQIEVIRMSMSFCRDVLVDEPEKKKEEEAKPIELNPLLKENVFFIHDIDSNYNSDLRFFSKYAYSIYQHYRSIESLFLPRDNYMVDVQKGLEPRMRCILVDWIVEIADECNLRNETLFLTVNYIDRFLSIKPINKQQLQLMACACLSLANKYEECAPLRLSQIIYLSCNAYTKQQLKDYEVIVMNTLQFHFTVTTSYRMIKRYLLASSATSDESFLAIFILELSLIHYRFIRTLPSLLAAASLYLSRSILHIDPVWTDTLVEHSEYTEDMLHSVVSELRTVLNSKPPHELLAVYNKYSKKVYNNVSTRFSPFDPSKQ